MSLRDRVARQTATSGGSIAVRLTATQVLILVGVFIACAYAVISEADGWADWVVFSAIVLTTLGFAIAVRPKIYERRKRTISRESPEPRRPRH